MRSDDLARAAARIAAILGDASLLIGGLAVSAWGHVRATEDVDFVSSSSPDELQRLLAADGIETELERGDVLEGDIPWVLHGRVQDVPFQVLPPLVPIHWENATVVAMPDGGELRVVDLPDLLRLKLRAGGARDLWDVAVLLQKHPSLRDDARQWAKELGKLVELDAWLDDPRL